MAIHRHLFGPARIRIRKLEGLAQPIRAPRTRSSWNSWMRPATCSGCWGTDNLRTLPLSDGVGGDGSGLRQHGNPVTSSSSGINGLFGERMARSGGAAAPRSSRWSTNTASRRWMWSGWSRSTPGQRCTRWCTQRPSTGVVSDVAAMGEAKGDALLLADAVTSIGGWELAADEWGIDVGYAGTQKCLGVPPGLAPFTINERAWNRRVTTPQSWYLDLGLLGGYVTGGAGGGRTYHHTAPTGMVAGLHAGLKAVLAEGIPAAAKRHRDAGEHFQTRVQERGWGLFAAEGHRLPMLTSVVVPEGVDSAKVRGWLLENKDIEIGAGTGPYASKIWRIGLMGPNATIEKADFLFDAIVEAVESV